MTEHQLDEIKRTRQSGEHVEIRSPAAGFILTKNITLGQRFERGSELYRISDLSKVWIVADTLQTEASFFKPGMQAMVSVPNPKKTFPALVANVPPRFDSVGRTLQVRLEVDNPGLLLRPDMFVDVELPVSLPAAITASVDAVIETGIRSTVYVNHGGGYFEPRRVDTGLRFGRQVEITGGLMPGEKIVVSGNFLIDSESRMRAVAAGTRGQQSKDPVCGMFVNEEKAEASGRTSQYEGRTYFFCCDHCEESFERDPKKYLDQGADKQAQSDNSAVLANVKNGRIQPMGEEQDIQAVPDRPGVPPRNMEIRGMHRRRGGHVATEPAMSAGEKHEQQDGGAIPDQPDPSGHDHD